MNDYFLTDPGAFDALKRDESNDKTDIDVIRENSKFLWDDDDIPQSWAQHLAKRYYDKLFKEYCIADLTRYQSHKIALRWRIQKEVVSGKGQFICGNKRCLLRDDLTSWEVNFAYNEDGVRKNALCKLRLCPGCSLKLNYGKKRRKARSQLRTTAEINEVTDEEKAIPLPPPPSQDATQQAKSDSQSDSVADKKDGEYWSQPVKTDEDDANTREDEMDSFLQDLLM